MLDLDEKKYIPISLDSLASNSIPNFDLFVFNSEKKQYVLYRSKNLQLKETQIEYIKKKFRNLFIELKDKNNYLGYVENHISYFLNNNNIATDEKAETLYEISNTIIDGLFKDNTSPVLKERTKNIINVLTNKISNSKDIFPSLIKMMSYNYTLYTHSTNVATFAINFAKILDINDINYLENIGLGAFLHDIGKIKMPKEILEKKDKLTDEEMEIIKTHPTEGYKIVMNMFPDNKIVQNIVKYHHEKIDGTGYPEGLAEEEIPEEAQIVTLADIFDAITSNRSYAERIQSYEAFLEMSKESKNNKYSKTNLKKFILMFSGLSAKSRKT